MHEAHPWFAENYHWSGHYVPPYGNYDFVEDVDTSELIPLQPSYESLLAQDQLLCLAAVDPKNNGPECGSTNNPIAIGTGNKWLVERDVAGALGFSRTYNSNPATPSSVFGEHWMGSHTQRLEFDAPAGVRAIRADGKIYRFNASGSSYTADADVVERLGAEFGSGGTPVGYRLETADHGVERYDVAGRLSSVTTAMG